MKFFSKFRRKHPYLILEHPAHILRIRIPCQLRNLIQLQLRPQQKSFDSVNPVSSHRLRKSGAGLLFELPDKMTGADGEKRGDLVH